MKYVERELGEAAEVSAGGGGRGLGREIVIVVGAMLALVTAIYFGIGWVVEWTLPWISPEREQRWFENVSFGSGAEVTHDEERLNQRDQAAAILDRLRRDPAVSAIRYELVLMPDSEPNAFAIPGGKIAVTYGLLDAVGDDEVALAFVLGHELGHFAQRDHLRGLGRQIGRSLVWLLVFGDSGGMDALSKRTTEMLDLGHSRHQESGADRFGVRLVLAAYGSADGTDRLFRWLAEHDRSPAWLALLSTHPAPANRIEALRGYAAEFAAEAPGGG